MVATEIGQKRGYGQCLRARQLRPENLRQLKGSPHDRNTHTRGGYLLEPVFSPEALWSAFFLEWVT
jgi:hypothetical protein